MNRVDEIRAIIVDDEKDSRETLRRFSNKYTPDVKILEECKNIEEAKKAILKHDRDLVFLEIEMVHHLELILEKQ